MAIGFGAIVAFSPTKLAISILYLSGRVAPVARALAFLIGNTIVIGSVAVLTYLGGVVILGTTTGIPPTASDWLDVVLGIILLAIAAYGLARPGAIGPATLGVGDSDLRPRLGTRARLRRQLRVRRLRPGHRGRRRRLVDRPRADRRDRSGRAPDGDARRGPDAALAARS